MTATQSKSRLLSLASVMAALPLVVAMMFSSPAQAQPAATQQAPAAQPATTDTSLQIVWEVRNRFRLFREERDFQLQAEALRSSRSISSAHSISSPRSARDSRIRARL